MINSDTEAGIFYRDDTITVFYIPPNAPQTTLSDGDAAALVGIEGPRAGQLSCRSTPLCGFKDGSARHHLRRHRRVRRHDDDQVQEAALHLQHNKSIPGNELSKKYGAGAQIAQVQQRTYYRNAATNQLMYYDGDQRDEAVVDNVDCAWASSTSAIRDQRRC